MKGTGVHATKEELAELEKLADAAENTPAITMASNQQDFASVMWERVEKATHACALEHGLPEIDGYYGVYLDDGEFVTV